MNKYFFTISGINHYFGKDIFEKDMKVKLVKEPDNKHDKEAIKVIISGLGCVGYVANNTYTVIGESMSAGRLYDKIGKEAEGTVMYVMNGAVLCSIENLPQGNNMNAEIHMQENVTF